MDSIICKKLTIIVNLQDVHLESPEFHTNCKINSQIKNKKLLIYVLSRSIMNIFNFGFERYKLNILAPLNQTERFGFKNLPMNPNFLGFYRDTKNSLFNVNFSITSEKPICH